MRAGRALNGARCRTGEAVVGGASSSSVSPSWNNCSLLRPRNGMNFLGAGGGEVSGGGGGGVLSMSE